MGGFLMHCLDRRPYWVALVGAAITLLAAGCGGSGGAGGSGGSTPDQEKFVLQAKAKVLPANAAPKVDADGTVRIKAALAPGLQAGDTLVYDGPGTAGFVYKAASVQKAGDTIEVVTSKATLVDVFAEADIKKDHPVSAQELQGLEPAVDGVVITSLDRGRADAFTTEFKFNQVKIAGEGNATASASIDGSVKVALGFRTALDIRPGSGLDVLPRIRTFRAVPYLRVNGSLALEGKANAEFKRRLPVSLPFSFPVAGLGPVPVNGKLQMFVEVEGRATAGGKIVLQGGLYAEAGIEYVDNNWGLVHKFDNTLKLQPPQGLAQASLRLSAVQPQLGIEIPGIGDVGVSSDVMRAMVTFTHRQNPEPAGFIVTSRGDFRFVARAKLGLGPVTVYDGAFAEYSFGGFNLLAPFFLPDTTTRIVYCTGKRLYSSDASFKDTVVVYEANEGEGNIQGAALSYDGRRIAFIIGGKLAVINADGTDPRYVAENLSIAGVFFEARPGWSPDNKKVAVAAVPNDGQKAAVLEIPVDGGQARFLTLFDDLRNPVYSPNGSTIVCQRVASSGFFEIWEYDTGGIPGSGRFWARKDPGSLVYPSYHPNGNSILCSGVDGGIYVVDGLGAAPRMLANTEGFQYPTYSPDGSQIAFARWAAGNTKREIGLCDFDGKNPVFYDASQLGGAAFMPSWQIVR
jgi:hypothetical protein